MNAEILKIISIALSSFALGVSLTNFIYGIINRIEK